MLPPLKNDNFSKCNLWGISYLFYFLENPCSFSKYSFLYTLTVKIIYFITREVEYIFGNISWILNHLVMELGQLTDIDIGNIFSEKFAWLGGMGPKSRPFLNIHGCSNHSNLEMKAECLTKTLSYLNLNVSRTKNGRNKL